MKFNKKLEKAINEDLEARKARARFYEIEHDKYVAELEKEIEFYEYISKGEVPPTWVARYCEEDGE
ncbi:hypothetical protein DUK53_16020 [Listeria sp. SHR_NRA_18]|uniref:hypothetical protein n=1 Tax=Listeria sp. SHR_NRA_18 TaxID=2269046 RepID=UPI000F5E6D63|nr:hypothetical protein [Listeria sp. SHR_NRA_18]RQW65458.1 hypothetical protein DUK53_16020 [Listeria sp. SHR_NRA_18]